MEALAARVALAEPLPPPPPNMPELVLAAGGAGGGADGGPASVSTHKHMMRQKIAPASDANAITGSCVVVPALRV